MKDNTFWAKYPSLKQHAHLPGVQELKNLYCVLESSIQISIEGYNIQHNVLGVNKEKKKTWSNVVDAGLSPYSQDGVLSSKVDLDCFRAFIMDKRGYFYRDEGFASMETYGAILKSDVKNRNMEASKNYSILSSNLPKLISDKRFAIIKEATSIFVEANTPENFKPLVEKLKEANRPREIEWLYEDLDTVKYRMQAMMIFHAISDVIMTPEMTKKIDSGKPILKDIRNALGLTKAEVEVVRNIGEVTSFDITRDIRSLLLANISANLWLKYFSKKGRDLFFLSGQDYNDQFIHSLYASKASEVKDSCNSFIKDVVEPLLNETGTKGIFDRKTRFPLFTSENIKPAVVAFHKAIIGNRSPEGFAKAALETHRFAASIEAKKLEMMKKLPPWPALFQDWTSQDGVYEAKVLTSAEELVAEGLAMEHCVGSYAGDCRNAKTHIVSIRVNGKREATLEINLNMRERPTKLVFAQFKGRLNERPSEEAHEALRTLKLDIASKRCIFNGKEVLEYAKLVNEYEWKPDVEEYTIEKAEKIWPIYRDFFLTGVTKDMTLKQWSEETGLLNALEGIKSDVNPVTTTEEIEEQDSHFPARIL